MSRPGNTTFLRPDVKLIYPPLLIPYCAMFAVSCVVYALIIYSAVKLLRGDAVVEHQSVPFLIGFMICISIFGAAAYIVEIWFSLWNCSLSPYRIYFLLLSSIFLFLPILVHITAILICNPCCICSSFLKILLPLCPAFSIFVFIWLCVCGFPTLLLGFAYPLDALSLVVLHVAFVFTVTVAFAAVLNDIIFWWNLYSLYSTYKKTTVMGIMTHIIGIEDFMYTIVSIVLVALGCFAYAGIMIGFALTVAQGFVTTEGANSVVSFIPSLFLFLIGGLIKWSFFTDSK